MHLDHPVGCKPVAFQSRRSGRVESSQLGISCKILPLRTHFISAWRRMRCQGPLEDPGPPAPGRENWAFSKAEHSVIDSVEALVRAAGRDDQIINMKYLV